MGEIGWGLFVKGERHILVEEPRVVSSVLPPVVIVEITGMVVMGSREEEPEEEPEEDEPADSDEELPPEEAVAAEAPEEKMPMAGRAVPEAEASADWQYCSPYWLICLMSVFDGQDSVEQSRRP